MTDVSNLKSRRRKRVITDQEKHLQDVIFGKDIVTEVKKQHRKADSATLKSDIAVSDSVWRDDEEEDLRVDLNRTSRLKKLKKSNQVDSKVSGSQLTSLLQERFKTRDVAWATVGADQKFADDNDTDDDEDLLMRAGTMVEGRTERTTQGGPLPEGRIGIVRMVDANAAENNRSVVRAVKFHPSGRLLMSGGDDKNLRFFRIDGDKNEKQLSVLFKEMSILSASFLGTSSSCSEVVVAGRKPFFYSYDTASGAVSKIPGLMGRGLKTHEHMAASPLGTRIAFAGPAGYIHVLCGRLKTWQMDLKMNCPCRHMAFLDEDHMFSSGQDADVYLWDLRYTGRCIQRFPHSDGTGTSAIAAHPISSAPWSGSTSGSGACYLSVGAASGVVTVFEGSASAAASEPLPLRPVKSVMNLTTIVSSLAFHPSGELLAVASDDKKDQLRLVHLPSASVYTSWPTERTPLGKVSCMDFSAGGAYFAIGNRKGRVLLYKLNHFTDA